MEDHINVAIRVRPLNQREARSTSTTSPSSVLPWHVNRDTITQRHFSEGRVVQGSSFTFDKVFDQKDSTQMVYDDIVKGIIASSMSGFNGTIFAYGQTSSGKTHTMHGSEAEPGIIKLAVNSIFGTVANDKAREYLIRVSFLEIYNEILRDLLEPTKTNLKIHENAKREIFVGDLSEHIVFNTDQVEDLLVKGDRNRHIAGTNMNERSSRSHTIFRIVIESREKAEASAEGSSSGTSESDSASLAKKQQRLSTGSFADSDEFTGAVKVSCLNLVDLAGSERVGQTGAEGQRLKEGAHINKSLLALGTVIARLSEDGGDRGHIPYRDSKITRILQPSLGGNAKTLIVCTVTPSPDYVDETLSTLKFASRAKTIQNKPEVNEELRGDALLRRLKRASELEKEVAHMKEIEKKKIKIEADNELLLRQLWKSQKERDRLQKELELQQSNMFVTRQADGKDADDTVNSVRRQTWFPGLQLPLADAPTAMDTSAGPSPGADFPSENADTDCHVQSRLPEFADVSRLHRMDIDQAKDLELRNESLQQQNDELAKCSQEMEATIQRFMRDYNLLLSTLSHLAAADVIPPSPAKSEPTSTPRELVQIRRKLRALMTTIDASQKQCVKFRSQRPEAAFLELELQAVRETLIQKEEELVEVMRESDEVFAKYREAEAQLGALGHACRELENQMAVLADARDSVLRANGDLQAQAEKGKQVFESVIQKQKIEATQLIEQAESRYRSEMEAHKAKLDEQLHIIESLNAQNEQREKDYLSQLSSMQATADGCHQTIKELSVQLAEANANCAAVEGERNSLANARMEASHRQTVIDRLNSELNDATSKAAEYYGTIAALEVKTRQLEDSIQARLAKESEQAAEISNLSSELGSLRDSAAAMQTAHASQIAGYESKLDGLQTAHAQEKQKLANQLQEQSAKAERVSIEIGALSEQLETAEKEKHQLASALSDVNQQAGVIPGLQQEASRLQKELSCLQLAKDRLAETLASKQRDLDRIAKDRSLAQTKIDELEAQNSDIWERVSELTVANNELLNKAAEAEKACAERRTYAEAIEKELSAVVDERDSFKTRVDELLETHAASVSELDTKEKQLQEALKAKVLELDNAYERTNHLQAASDKLSTSNKQLSAGIEELKEQISQARKSVAEGESLAASLKADLEKSETNLADSRSENKRLAQDLSSQAAELGQINAELEQSRSAYEQASSSIVSLSAESSNLQTRLADATALLQATEQKLALLRSEHASLQEELQETKLQRDSDMAAWERQLREKDAGLEKSAAEMQAAVAEYKKQVSELETREQNSLKRAKHLDDALVSTRKKLESLEAALADKDQSNSAAVALNTELRQKLSSSASSLEQLQSLTAELESSLKRKDQQLLGLQAEYQAAADKAENNLNAKASEIAELQSSIEAISLELENSKQAHAESLALLKSQIKSGSERIDLLQHSLASSENAVSKLEQQLESAELARDEQQRVSIGLQSEVETIAEKLSSADQAHYAEAAELHETLDRLKQQIERERDSARNDASEAEAARSALESHLSLLQRELGDTKAELASTEKAREMASSDLQKQVSLVQKLTASAGDSEQHIKDIEESYAGSLALLKSQLQEAAVERGRLSQAATDKQAKLDSLSAEIQSNLLAISSYQAECSALKSENAALASKHDHVCTELGAAKSKLESSARISDGLRVQLVEFEKAVAAKTEELERAKSESDSAASSHDAALAEMHRVQATAESEISKLQWELRDAQDASSQLARQMDELARQKEEMQSRLHASEDALCSSNSCAQESRAKLAELEEALSERTEALALAHEEVEALRAVYSAAQKTAIEHISSLEAEVEGLCDQLLAKSTEAAAVSKKLDDSVASMSQLSTKCDSLIAEQERLQKEHEALAERASGSQIRLEQALSEARDEISSKDIVIQGLETALDKANELADAARSDAQNTAMAESESLNAQVRTLQDKVAELNSTIDSLHKELEQQSRVTAESDVARMELAKATIDSLTEERDGALSGIETLKDMMTELAQVKDDEIAELEASVEHHKAMVESSLRASLERDEGIEQSKKAAAEQLDRVNKLYAETEEELAQAKLKSEQLEKVQHALQSKLDAALQTAAQKNAQLLCEESQVKRLNEDISQRIKSEKELHAELAEVSAKLAEALASAEKANADLGTAVVADLSSIVDALVSLPSSKSIAASLSVRASDRSGLLETIRRLVLAAQKATSGVAKCTEAEDLKQEAEKLSALNAKLEKQNIKLRDVYKADMTELHAEVEKQRQKADSLAQELAVSTEHAKRVQSELDRVKGELGKQHRRRSELEAKLAAAPMSRPATPENAMLAVGRNGANPARLASERTPAKTEAKRMRTNGKGIKDPAPAMPLSPVPSNKLNSRFARHGETAADTKDAALAQQHPARKRTAVADTASPAATKTEAARARSSYGDRRRIRRNQAEIRKDALEEQAAEQCAQQ